MKNIKSKIILITILLLTLGVFVANADTITANFPTSLDAWDDGDIIEDEDLEAIQAKIGIDNSNVTTSIDWLIKASTSTLGSVANITASDGVFVVGDGSKFVGESGATARTSLGLVIGTDVQAFDAFLDDIADLTDPGADRILFWDDSEGNMAFLTVSTGLSLSTTNLAVSGLTTSELAASTLVIESEGISSNDNDTTLPTSAAVKDYVDSVAGTGASSDTEILFNNSGSIDGVSTFTTDGSTLTMTATTTIQNLSVGTSTATSTAPFHVVADASSTLVRFEENSGLEYMDIDIDSSGDLHFISDGGVTKLSISDDGLTIAIPGDIEHIGDTDTQIGFLPDQIDFDAGGIEFLSLDEDTQDLIEFNTTATDIDFTVKASGVTDALLVQGSDGQITLGALGAGLVIADSSGVLSAGTTSAGDYGAATIDGDDINSNIAGRSLTLTSASPDTLDADPELYTDTKCIYFEDPTGDDDFNSIWRNSTANDVTLTELWAESDQTVTFMLQVDDGSPADIDSVDLAPAAGEAEDTSLDGDTTLASDEELDLAVTSVANTPTWVSICWTFTWND